MEFSNGGIVNKGITIRLSDIAVDECIIFLRTDGYRCERKDVAHLIARHEEDEDEENN